MNKKYFSSLLIFLSVFAFSQNKRKEIGNLVMEGVPEIPKQIFEKLNLYLNVYTHSVADWKSDGNGLYIIKQAGSVSQAHLLDKPMGTLKQLTNSNEPVTDITASNNSSDHAAYFSRDIGGNENFQVYKMDVTSGKEIMLTDGKSRNTGFRLNASSDKIIFNSTLRNGKDNDLYIKNVNDTLKPLLIHEADGGGWGTSDWSEDGKWVILEKYVSINESYMYLLEIATKKITQINPVRKKISYGGAKFTKDGKGIYYTSDEDTENLTLRYYEIATGKSKLITESIGWGVESFILSRNGKFMVFNVNEEGFSKLYLMDCATNSFKGVELPGYPVIGGISYHPSKNIIAYTLNSGTVPGDVYVIDFEKNTPQNPSPVQWTVTDLKGLKAENFVEPQLIRFETFDNNSPLDVVRTIPAFVYKPKNLNGKKAPVIISIHGGPEGQSRPVFSSFVQYLLAEKEVAVILPNVRGSTGYGKTYTDLDNGFLREDAVRDIGKLLDWIAEQPDLDPERIMVWGGSYGGYMTLASMTNFNAKLAGGIDVVGISNFNTFLKNTSDYRRDLRRVEYGDERDPAMYKFLDSISPNNNVHKITKPMFIVQGLNDPRVPASEAEQMVEALKKNGNITWYLLAKDEGHGFRKKTNRDFYNAAVVLFIEENLIIRKRK